MNRLQSRAPAKVNLTLRILAKRADGYHDLVSLVAFAEVGDELSFVPGARLDLDLVGRNAAGMGAAGDNLVLIAARALAERIEGLRLGRFDLRKHLPVGAGLGGGSADAAAALRLVAEANGLALGDPRLLTAASVVGADVPACLESKARLVAGIGERLSPPLLLPPLFAVIAFPGVPLATAAVYGSYDELGPEKPRSPEHPPSEAIPLKRETFIDFLRSQTNDLAPAARALAPAIAAAEERLRRTPGVRLVRMSGSGSSVFALYDEPAPAKAAAKAIGAEHSDWWVAATALR